MTRKFPRTLSCFTLLTAALVTTGALAQVRVMQTNSRDSVLHLLDPVTHEIVAEIEDIPIAHGIAAAPDGSRMYVSAEAETAVKVIDTASMEIIATIPLSARPNNVSLTPDGKKLYVGIIAQPGAIDVIDTEALENVKSIDVPGGIHNIYVLPLTAST